MEKPVSDRLVWIDLEMTGLDPERHVILEIGSIVTDGDLEVLAEGPNLFVHHDEEALSTMDDWSRSHHEASGLLERVRRSSISCAEAEEQTLRFLSRWCDAGKAPLCGNSIWQDRRFLARWMPRLEGFFHYRIIDVSSLKELVGRWYPHLPSFQKKKAHLALSDIRESIEELRYYRGKVFVKA